MVGGLDKGMDGTNASIFVLGAIAKQTGARVGKLALRGRKSIATPNFIGNTSRGTIPHVTQDIFSDEHVVGGLYVGLEDFIERAPKETPPIFNYKPPDGASPLRRFTALDDETTLILGPRRLAPVTCPTSNTSSSISIFTNVGFTHLSVSDYSDAFQRLRPDIAVGLADIPFGDSSFSRKRKEMMTDRTSRWMLEQVDARSSKADDVSAIPALFAPLLPIPAETQSWYLDELLGHMQHRISGLAVYDTVVLEDLPNELQHLPRLALTEPATPQALLAGVAQGVDLFTIPFIGTCTDAGIALDFSFPAPKPTGNDQIVPLGTDMWLQEHERELSPLSKGCDCYACRTHHRAYLRHLLAAKEMLGWVLLQLHNHKVLARFFAGVRESIEAGRFEDDRRDFEAKYEPALPARTGQGPRVRGYQYKSGGPSEAKRNPAAYRTLNDATECKAESAEAVTAVEAVDPADSGLAEKVQ